MSGAYGTFIESFPELYESCEIWNQEDASDKHVIRAVYMPTEGGGLKRRKYTSGNTALDIVESDEFYVDNNQLSDCKEGTYVRRLKEPQWIRRLTKDLGFDVAAGYHVFKIERVTGATIDKQKELVVKEGYFA